MLNKALVNQPPPAQSADGQLGEVRELSEHRVLLLPPTSRDATAIQALLTQNDIPCKVCATILAMCNCIREGAGAVLISEEALGAEPGHLAACFREQPVWSDLPVIVLSRSEAESPSFAQMTAELGNCSVIERPVRVTTLISVIRSALRARERQYQVRGHLARRDRLTAEREELLQSERAARSEAERASRMKDEFLATLSHELRTPLNAILGWAQIIRAHPNDLEDVTEGIEVIERNALSQTQIIEDLLDMSRIISGKVRLDVELVDLAQVVTGAMQTIRPAADAKRIQLHCALDPLAPAISGDPSRLQQIFWNLLTNAVKFTPADGKVQIRLERVKSNVEVSVIDTGEGIEPMFLPHVFDRFRQADATTTRRHGGLGLGLAIVKQLTELHGGTVRVNSTGKNQGATFVVSVPVAAVRAEADQQPEHNHPTPMTLCVPNNAHSRIDGVKILVVDDEPDSRTMLKRVLEDCRAVVETAGSAAEAFEKLHGCRPDVLISDIGMPTEDGYALIRRLRAMPPDQGGQIPAVALSAYARSEDRVKAILAGFQHHVAKPVASAELITLVAGLAGRASV